MKIYPVYSRSVKWVAIMSADKFCLSYWRKSRTCIEENGRQTSFGVTKIRLTLYLLNNYDYDTLDFLFVYLLWQSEMTCFYEYVVEGQTCRRVNSNYYMYNQGFTTLSPFDYNDLQFHFMGHHLKQGGHKICDKRCIFQNLLSASFE